MPPYDRTLALASLVTTMRTHFLEVRCGCGARRVIALAQMAKDSRMAGATLAHVALRVRCEDCTTGPDEVHLCATIYGLVPATHGPDPVWTIPLVERGRRGSYQRRKTEW